MFEEEHYRPQCLGYLQAIFFAQSQVADRAISARKIKTARSGLWYTATVRKLLVRQRGSSSV